MKTKIIAILVAYLSCVTMYATKVFVIPIDGEIGSTTWLYTKNGLKQACEDKADLIIVHLNTFGGALLEADSMRTALRNCPISTVAFVDHNAASAGALVALACDSVFMNIGSSMGAATVVDGSGVPLPDKYQSYMRSIMRSTAQSHGKIDGLWRRNPIVAEAMVDPKVVVDSLVGNENVVTFTAEEAVKWRFAEGVAKTLDQVLTQLDVHNAEVEEYSPSFMDDFIGFLNSSAVKAILVMLIIGGLYFELQSPGVGFPSAAAIISATLYFTPTLISGIGNEWIVLLFVVGVVLLALEIFVIPGFGIFGILGALMLLVSLVLAALPINIMGQFDFSNIWYAIIPILTGCVLAVIAIVWLSSRFAPQFIKSKNSLTLAQNISDGYIGVDMTPADYVGRKAVAVTDLRPAGKIMVEGHCEDAVSLSGFICEQSDVIIMKYENSQLYVVLNIEKDEK